MPPTTGQLLPPATAVMVTWLQIPHSCVPVQKIGVQRTVRIEAARCHRPIRAAGIIAVHGKAHCTKGQAELLCLLRLCLSTRIIVPHTEHTADYRAAAKGTAANHIVAPVGSIGIAAVKIIILAQHVIEVTGGFDDFEAITDQIGSRARTIVVSAAGPVAYHNVLVKGTGLRTNRSTVLLANSTPLLNAMGIYLHF